MAMKSLSVINSDNRNSSIDIFRAFAILGVVFFHFNNLLPYGFLGVDLFFVISGLLVGGILTRQYFKNEKINFLKFILQRAFKIWPSYFIFLIIGTLIAVVIYHDIDNTEIIPVREYWKYIVFLKNYSFEPVHGGFDQVWSLCVEEHFYILLPVAFVLLQKSTAKKSTLIIGVALAIVSGIILKILSLYFTRSGDTSFKTHTRIDTLAWGVLLNIILTSYDESIRRIKRPYLIFVAAVAMFIITMVIEVNTSSVFYHKIVLHTIIPFEFVLMIFGLYNYDFSKLKVLRFIAYYSYNWYLWHPLFIVLIVHYLGKGVTAFVTYFIFSFLLALLFTIVIEEPFLRLRSSIIQRLFRKNSYATTKSGI